MCDTDQASEITKIRRDGGQVVVRWLVDLALALHFAAGAFWWWLSPKGFPLTTSQFWTNSVLPIAAMAAAGAGLVAMHRQNGRFASAIVICFSAAWASAAISGRIVFPVSLDGVWILFLIVAATGAGLYVLLAVGLSRATLPNIIAAIAGATIGILVVFGQIPPSPTTLPFDRPLVGVEPSFPADAGLPSQIKFGSDARFLPRAAQLEGQANGIWFECRPLLEFHSTSSDRFWSLLNRQRPREPRCVAVTGQPPTQTCHYDNGATITFASPISGEVIAADVRTPVTVDTYSHLNTYCYLRIYARDSLTLTFSPCGSDQFAILPADYPFGRPARFAYLDADGTFRVCQATSGEKGPFQTLGSGRLDRAEPLTISFFNDRKFVVSITLEDWSAQASTALSPSAGWGVPINAIEFQVVNDDGDQSVGIWITLAGTSVGRGFETVGHNTGTYRNRFTIRSELNDQE